MRAGHLYYDQGLLGPAEASYQQSLDKAEAISSRLDRGQALAGLGRCALAADRPAEARARLEQALQILEPTGAAVAAEVAAELSRLPADPA